MKEVLAIALPTLTVLVGILLNRSDSSKLESRLTNLENRLHADFLHLIGKVSELESRMTRLESAR